MVYAVKNNYGYSADNNDAQCGSKIVRIECALGEKLFNTHISSIFTSFKDTYLVNFYI
jgi:hypothetical protein